MAYQIRNAQEADFQRIMEIYAGAQRFMVEHGNPDQWGSVYPSEEMILQDISQEKLFVAENAQGIHGVFFFDYGPDPTYLHIENGAWSQEAPYGVIHRIAGDGSGGILREAVEFTRQKVMYLRIDTHENNYVMQKALEKLGFKRCGIIYVEDGTPRIAYDR